MQLMSSLVPPVVLQPGQEVQVPVGDARQSQKSVAFETMTVKLLLQSLSRHSRPIFLTRTILCSNTEGSDFISTLSEL
jgi:hypothetical protein